MALAPIALFIYRRPAHARRTLEALRACPELAGSPLHIYCDGARSPDARASVAEARAAARALAPPSTVFVEREHNLGLARSIIAGTTELVERHGKVIVLEEDLEVAPVFLRYMNGALDRYEHDERVMQISGYQFPLDPPLDVDAAFFAFPSSLGWATWARAWRHFDETAAGYAALAADPAAQRRFDLDGSYPYFAMLQRQLRGEADSWGIRWVLSVFEHDGVVLFPGRSLVRNFGDDGTGTHDAPGARLPDAEVATVTTASWRWPEVAVDQAAQRRAHAFLAEETARRRRELPGYLARRWTRKLLDAASPRRLYPARGDQASQGASSVLTTASRWTRALLAHPRVPPGVRLVGNSLLARVTGGALDAGEQDLDLYWDPDMAAILETWGTGNAWNEIQLLLANVHGTVIDIACGTGKVMTLLAPYPALEVHGFDISDFLIQKAIDRGIPRDRLAIADATRTPYTDDQFDYGYSIGSLEHFTEDGIPAFLAEARRITRFASMHQIPTARSGRDEGWMKGKQSYHNNSVGWWLDRFRAAYPSVHVLDSAWQDKVSVGKWFLCVKAPPSA